MFAEYTAQRVADLTHRRIRPDRVEDRRHEVVITAGRLLQGLQRSRDGVGVAPVSHLVEPVDLPACRLFADVTSPLCASPNVITDAPSENRFVLARVDGTTGTLDLDLDDDGEVGCEEILEAQPVLRESGTAPYAEPDHGECP